MHAERSNEMKRENAKEDEKQTGAETNIPIVNE